LRLLAIAFVAEPEFQRELDYALLSTPMIIRHIILFLATRGWKYTKFLQDIVMPIFLLYGRKNVNTPWKHIGGTTVSLKRQRIAIENSEGLSTAFIHSPTDDPEHSKSISTAGILTKSRRRTGSCSVSARIVKRRFSYGEKTIQMVAR